MVLWWLVGGAMGAAPCGTHLVAPGWANLPRPPEVARLGPDKGTRDHFDLPNAMESENFVVRWGNTGSVKEADVAAILEAFEETWEVEIGLLDHPAPPSTEAWKFNVYVGDTGSGSPDDYGTAGYFNPDPEGYPMVVLAPATVAEPAFGRNTAAHEFYHAVQHGLDTYAYAGASAWYWEATASWIEAEVFPEDDEYAVFLFGFAFLPHLELNFFDYPDTGQLQEYHQYGAFIFPRYLTEVVGDAGLVRDSWVEPTSADPLESLRAGVEAGGGDFDLALLDFAARNATWDYADGAAYREVLDFYAEYWRSSDHRVALELPEGGTTRALAPPEALLPRRYGYNVLTMEAPQAGELTLRFVGDTLGSEGSEARWGLMVIYEEATGLRYEEVPVVDGLGEAELGEVGELVALHLALMPRGPELEWDETFAYTVELQDQSVGEQGDSGGGAAGGGAGRCGCRAVPTGAGGSWLALFAPLVLLRRRA